MPTLSKTIPARKVTSLDIAKMAGVTRSTVSRVLNNQAETHRISAETAKKIKTFARELNYVPNSMARNLRLQRTNSIALSCGNLEYNWAHCILEGAEKVLDNTDYNFFISTHKWDVERERKESNSIISRRDEGVICQPIPGSENYRLFSEHNIPFVFIADALETMEEASFVSWDSAPATKVAIKHLVDIGRRKIGFIGVKHGTVSTRARYLAYEEILKEVGLEFNPLWVAKELSVADMTNVREMAINKVVSKMMLSEHPPDGLFILNDAIAFSVLEVLHKIGVKVPDDVAVIGMGDLPMSKSFAVGLSTMREPLEEIGLQSIEVLLELIENPGKGPIRRILKNTELKIRRTTLS